MLFEIITWIKSLGSKPVDETPVPLLPGYEPKPGIDLDIWTAIALKISASFESDDGQPQVTGDFDGCGLTCGYLGWTMRWKNQTAIVDTFIRKHGDEIGKKYMPKKWFEYRKVIYMKTDSEMISAVKSWSNGYNVHEPYLSELRTFWRSPEMIKLQIQFAKAEQSQFAYAMMLKTCDFIKCEPTIEIFCFWFDWCVLNGPYKIPNFNETKSVSIEKVLGWAPFGYGYKDITKNLNIWKKIKMEPWQMFLMKIAMLRAVTSRPQFRAVVMNRRGTVALRTGFVNATLRNLDYTI